MVFALAGDSTMTSDFAILPLILPKPSRPQETRGPLRGSF